MLKFDLNLIEKCQANAPRYTSYPTADRFSLDYDASSHIKQLQSNIDKTTPISLYIHIPFCNTLCLYCACNKIITNDRSNISKYLVYLEKEIKLYIGLLDFKPRIVQLHFGGGSPSWMSNDEVSQVMDIIHKYFDLSCAHEVSMEIDPRHTNKEFIINLARNGFNRISIGLQDLDFTVQKAVNRVQSFEASQLVLNAARECGFRSTNVDLIYGLPFQTLDGFSQTIDRVVELRPDRIALFNYAHIPSIFMPQTRIKEEDLPNAAIKLETLSMSVTKLTEAGYVFIGMDHFALPDDELSIALKNGTMQRNFQGYSTFADTNMLAFGVSSIGFLGGSYYQNVKDLDSYYNSLDNNRLPIMRGVLLTDDDHLRKHIITEIMCQFKLDYSVIAKKFNFDFVTEFKTELDDLTNLANLGLIDLHSDGFTVSDTGRFLIRNVAVVFDKYYRQNQDKKRFSKVI